MGDHQPTEFEKISAFRMEFAPILEAVKSGKIKETNLPHIESVEDLGAVCLEPWEDFKNLIRKSLAADESTDLEALGNEWESLSTILKEVGAADGNKNEGVGGGNIHFLHWMKSRVTSPYSTLQLTENPNTVLLEWLQEDMVVYKQRYLDKQF